VEATTQANDQQVKSKFESVSSILLSAASVNLIFPPGSHQDLATDLFPNLMDLSEVKTRQMNRDVGAFRFVC